MPIELSGVSVASVASTAATMGSDAMSGSAKGAVSASATLHTTMTTATKQSDNANAFAQLLGVSLERAAKDEPETPRARIPEPEMAMNSTSKSGDPHAISNSALAFVATSEEQMESGPAISAAENAIVREKPNSASIAFTTPPSSTKNTAGRPSPRVVAPARDPSTQNSRSSATSATLFSFLTHSDLQVASRGEFVPGAAFSSPDLVADHPGSSTTALDIQAGNANSSGTSLPAPATSATYSQAAMPQNQENSQEEIWAPGRGTPHEPAAPGERLFLNTISEVPLAPSHIATVAEESALTGAETAQLTPAISANGTPVDSNPLAAPGSSSQPSQSSVLSAPGLNEVPISASEFAVQFQDAPTRPAHDEYAANLPDRNPAQPAGQLSAVQDLLIQPSLGAPPQPESNLETSNAVSTPASKSPDSNASATNEHLASVAKALVASDVTIAVQAAGIESDSNPSSVSNFLGQQNRASEAAGLGGDAISVRESSLTQNSKNPSGARAPIETQTAAVRSLPQNPETSVAANPAVRGETSAALSREAGTVRGDGSDSEVQNRSELNAIEPQHDQPVSAFDTAAITEIPLENGPALVSAPDAFLADASQPQSDGTDEQFSASPHASPHSIDNADDVTGAAVAPFAEPSFATDATAQTAIAATAKTDSNFAAFPATPPAHSDTAGASAGEMSVESVVRTARASAPAELTAALQAWNGGENVQARISALHGSGAARESEMSVAMQTDALGSVELRARVSGDMVGAAIGVERHDAHAMISNDLPALHQALQERQLRVGDLSVSHGSIHSGGSGGDGRSSQQRETTARRSPAAAWTSEPSTAIPEMSAFSDSGNTTNFFDSNGRLSVRA